MDSQYARQYRKLYQRHWWWRTREQLILSELRRTALSETGKSDRQILDVGCGDGLFFERLASFGNVHGIETDPSLVDSAADHASKIHLGMLDEDYQPPCSLDWVLMLDVLEHIEDPLTPLARAHQLIAPGGRLIITVPAYQLLWTRHDDVNQHFRRYRRKDLVQLIQQAGFQVDHTRYFFHWVFAAKLLVRIKEALIPGKPRPPRIPPAPLNTALGTLSRLERLLTGWMRLPLGSSLLLLATRPEESHARERP